MLAIKEYERVQSIRTKRYKQPLSALRIRP